MAHWVQDQHQRFAYTNTSKSDTTITLTEDKKIHNLHCRNALILVVNQRTLSCALYCVCICVRYVFAQSLYIITVFFFFFSLHAFQRPENKNPICSSLQIIYLNVTFIMSKLK